MNNMSYIDDNLLPDEKIIFRTKKHYIIFLAPAVFLLIALLFSTDLSFITKINETLYTVARELPVLKNIYRIPALLMLLAALYVGAQQWIMYITSDYAITDKRVIMKDGFFDRRICDTRLSTISHVTVDQTLLGQVLNYGTLTINGFGGTSDSFIQIANPNLFQKNVQGLLAK
jgi:uncharacterized membrane protein YdbT with pleckstrin-like domain